MALISFESNLKHTILNFVLIYVFETGCFMMHPYSKCVIERPLDRPMGFIFGPPEPKTDDKTKNPNKSKSPSGSAATTPKSPTRPPVLTASDRTNILCTFQPELGSRTIQVRRKLFYFPFPI